MYAKAIIFSKFTLVDNEFTGVRIPGSQVSGPMMLHSSWFTKIQIVHFNFNVKFSRGIFNLQEALLDVRSHFCLTKMPH
jgi:hypothetical protein